eukprot:scaffold2910_cov390-Prasinococcus_capsulatus_cf.AAC.58
MRTSRMKGLVNCSGYRILIFFNEPSFTNSITNPGWPAVTPYKRTWEWEHVRVSTAHESNVRARSTYHIRVAQGAKHGDLSEKQSELILVFIHDVSRYRTLVQHSNSYLHVAPRRKENSLHGTVP